MAETSTTSLPYEECRGVLRVYSDGSIVRSPKPSFDVPVHDDGSVAWKDVVFDHIHQLQLRLYKPAVSKSRLPIFYYIHGGGFCIGSRAWPNCQNYCFQLALSLQAVVVSPDYRLAPEHRLPAAIEDGFAAVKWLQAQAVSEEPDTWLTDLAPVRVRGYVLLAPFFGGTIPSKSEAEGPKEAFLNWELIDRFWRLSIPVGENTDHPTCESIRTGSKLGGTRLSMSSLRESNMASFTIDPNSKAANELMLIVKRFITENSSCDA
ncbi:hypothetical protein M0R45_015964 [Rubus argutus]|uniref:Alpha/beta hydrolase fold-3 domain-containing protein n=1 Tax=Rubus argutus TaxID=59490 RepID=A0AAW1XSB3_RUBAR